MNDKKIHDLFDRGVRNKDEISNNLNVQSGTLPIN